MTGIYYVDVPDWLRAAGLTVHETDGWEYRARSSGGFAAPPLGIQWHHTAGNMNLDGNLSWQTEGSEDAPIGNMLLWDDGAVYMIAAGAANTAGKGGPWTMSRGTVPLDKGNTTTWAIEAANNGVGQTWPRAQIDAYIVINNTLNPRFGNLPSDLFLHAEYAPTRKVDPATAAAVEGPWKPRSTNSSGTWNGDDVRAECMARAGAGPAPIPPPDPEPSPEPEPTPDPDTEDDIVSKLPTIKKGDRGDYVERMQHLLAAAGFMNPTNAANYDGIWGDGTDGAKQRFDVEHGLTPSPPTDCGSKSWESLLTGRKW